MYTTTPHARSVYAVHARIIIPCGPRVVKTGALCVMYTCTCTCITEDTWTALARFRLQVTAAPSGNRNAEGSIGEHDISGVSKYSNRKSIIVLHKMRQIPATCTSAVCITALHCVHLHVQCSVRREQKSVFLAYCKIVVI